MVKWKGHQPRSQEAEEEEKDYKGPNPRELLEPLFKQSSCSYRIESYWTYEVCHGKHIRQYHEEKETGQKINIHEYYLGNMLAKNLLFEKEREAEEKEKSNEIPTKNIEGQMTPYYPVGMGNGTPCSLKQNRPRSSTVMYICHPESKHEILSVAEVTTCEYEVVILTPLLCSHPKYRFRASPVNDIFCQSLPGSPFKPLTLRQLEQQEEILRVPFRRNKEEDLQSTKEERFPAIHKPIAIGSQPVLTVGTTHISKLTDDQLIKEFLSGSYCFHGGVGWWKYEFCYGKHVHQYHEDKDSGKTSVVVGTWNQEEHIEWAKKNTARAYHLQDDGTQTVRMVSHFYGNGDICDITDKPRQVTVKLKCKESDSPHAVTVYMLEPHSCQYILGTMNKSDPQQTFAEKMNEPSSSLNPHLIKSFSTTLIFPITFFFLKLIPLFTLNTPFFFSVWCFEGEKNVLQFYNSWERKRNIFIVLFHLCSFSLGFHMASCNQFFAALH
ncbi:endoplasmic reticulum lectin 1 isoform X3 [Pongo abelii]|uniref:endoplasmic reticulum lectin 1 isoform X3 n=1 Tax=Pongo abelii TaxID=9601 RepID=UPI0023E7EF5A|nr:endoplasmic reticulum lectin 1 isoform X3 [Pongo abelii]